MKSFLLGAKTEVKTLPYDAEVEYLESTGTQWIDTGFVPTDTSNMSVVAMRLDTSGQPFFCGSREYLNDGDGVRFYSQYEIGPNAVNYTVMRCATAQTQFSGTGLAATKTLYTVEQSGEEVFFKAGDLSATRTTTHIAWSGTQSVYMFAGNNLGRAAYFLTGRIFSFSASNGGVPVRDFIPVRVGQVGYMYDRVSGELFGNSGTGDFVIGPDKEVA